MLPVLANSCCKKLHIDNKLKQTVTDNNKVHNRTGFKGNNRIEKANRTNETNKASETNETKEKVENTLNKGGNERNERKNKHK